MKQTYLEEQRFYDSPLGKFPSVTTVLRVLNKPALIQWAVNQALAKVRGTIVTWEFIDAEAIDILFQEAKSAHRTIMDDAADLGSVIHKLAADSFMLFGWEKWKEQGIVPEPLHKAWDAFVGWRTDNDVKAIAVEKEVYHPDRFAGTLDFYGTIKDKPYIIDFKSGNNIWPEHVLQVAAYWRAWGFMTQKPVEGYGVLRLDKKTGEPEFKEYTYEEMTLAWQKFKCLLNYWLLEYSDKLEEKDEKV